MAENESSTQNGTMKLAPYGRRLGGYVLDAFLVGIGYTVLVVIFTTSRIPALGVLFGLALAIGYPWLMITYAQGQTLGMKAVKVRCLDAKTGQVPSLGKALGRTMAASLFGVILLGWLDLLWPAWDQKRQTLHDKLASTLVVDVGIAPTQTVNFG
jgi:uncharacterized RDD family membrane protein YckC